MKRRLAVLLALAAPFALGSFPIERITANVTIVRGPVNGVLIQRGGATLAIYGDPRPNPAKAAEVLFTHHRRDVAWAGRTMVRRGAVAIGPEAERAFFNDVGDFWEHYRTARFHDYADQSSRILAEPLPLAKTVRDGDAIEWRGLVVHILGTPGYTRGAVSYLLEIDGKRLACTGDLIYGDGKILDLFSLQDAIPAVKEDGYHGYAARAGDVLASLRKIAAWKPDVLIPARGPVIHNPGSAIAALTGRMQAVFRSHFTIDALRWYRGDQRTRLMAERVLGPAPVDWMPMADTIQEKLPPWIIAITNSRLLVSRTGAGFLIDCGNRRVIDEVERLQRAGTIKGLDGIYVTHYHDDHSNLVEEMAEKFHCPVYACREMQDILEHPEAYRMPCLTPNAIHNVHAMAEGATQHWNEFTFTYSYFPGQTIYHGGLVAARDGGPSVFFVGDSFTPSGIDDYCLLNRNLFAPEPGFLECLRATQKMTGDYLLINQHVPPAFRFSPQQVGLMIGAFEKQRDLVAALVPWDDPNFGVDEQWARFYPYTAETTPGGHLELKVILLNHSPKSREFRVTPRVPAGWKAPRGPLRVTIGPRQQGFVAIPITASNPGLSIVTADIAFGPWDLREWTEAMVTVKSRAAE